jgi:putative oxidoreductase
MSAAESCTGTVRGVKAGPRGRKEQAMSQEMSQGKRIGILVVSGLLTLVFLFAGGSKLAGAQMHVESFARWGYPQWFRVLTGLIEVTCAIGLWVPKARGVAAIGLVATMLGAIYTHLAHDEAKMSGIPLALLILAAIVAYARRDETLALLGDAALRRPFVK